VKPRARTRQRGAFVVATPSVEVARRRKRVDARLKATPRMLSKIREHVNERVSDLPWRRERATMPAIGPEPPTSPNESVHVKGDADGETTDTGGQGSRVARFYNQVQVVPLSRKVKDAKVQRVAFRGALNCKANGGKHVLTAQRAEGGAERHVNRVAGLVRWAGAMGDRRAASCGLSAGARAFAAPGVRKRELLLHEPA
jgi:hypothetical protein